MLNVLFGWINSSSVKEDYLTYIIESIENKSHIKTQKGTYPSGGICDYSKYKPSIHYSDEKYILSVIGQIDFHTKPTKNNSSDSVVNEILKQYEQSGCSFSKNLKGQFILSIIDKINNTCILINDAMATFPVYYTQHPDNQLIFSNHLSLITKSPSVDFHISSQAIYNYIYFHMIPSPGTIYENIFKLEPGQYLFYSNDKFRVQNYFIPSFNEEHSQNENDLSDKIFTTLDKSVRNCIDSPETTGCFLSGGLDSSAVAGMLAKNSDTQAKTFSIGFPVAEYNEIEYARTASETFNTQQHEYFIQPEDVDNVIYDIISSMDEPFGNSSVIPVYYCAKLAKENGITQLLAGDGGDEIFAGNTRYSKQQVFERYFLLPEFLRKKILEPFVNFPLFSSNFIGRKAQSYIRQANIPLPARMETYNFLHINSPGSVFTENFLSQIKQDEPVNLIDKTYNRPDNASYLNRMLFLDWKHTLADNDLRKVNMMCDLAGVDVSYPMLSPEMIELSCQIPSDLKLTPHKLRYLYKKSMKGFLPDSIINKSKHGFGLPFGIWTKTDKKLQKIAYNAINKLKTYHIFNEQFLDETIKNHQEVHSSYYGELIWILMVLGLWLEKNK